MFPLTPSHSSLLTANAAGIVAAGPRPQRPGGLVEHSQVPTNTYSLIQLQLWSLKWIFSTPG